MPLPSEIASNDAASDGEDEQSPQAPGEARFVITLCDEATPVRIPRAHLAHLNRFRFFGPGVRGGGPPYRIHMGYFPTRGDAEKWLQALLPIYPKATVCELPPAAPRAATDTA